ncbi:hypothetical protein AYM40_04105 [Paraburkholderia phytofirmans OLGA172]|uniref:PAAR domain-containing protein n=2 Tax=Paraburkholderia phytofirmans TaxID=261302 RepID=A0A160FHU7_9BURK|nr:hypothetical protein AYM40_04105 [Paraburkholderia phytofirmans OLGA172]
MAQRFDILAGDTTTAGGTVCPKSRADMMDGRAVAYEGDPVWCPECETTGWILGVGERPPDHGPDGRKSALSWDWCVCECDPKPLLIASQKRSDIRT